MVQRQGQEVLRWDREDRAFQEDGKKSIGPGQLVLSTRSNLWARLAFCSKPKLHWKGDLWPQGGSHLLWRVCRFFNSHFCPQDASQDQNQKEEAFIMSCPPWLEEVAIVNHKECQFLRLPWSGVQITFHFVKMTPWLKRNNIICSVFFSDSENWKKPTRSTINNSRGFKPHRQTRLWLRWQAWNQFNSREVVNNIRYVINGKKLLIQSYLIQYAFLQRQTTTRKQQWN